MQLTIEIDREEDGRYLAEVIELPGVMAYGQSQEEALAHVQAIALRELADRSVRITDIRTAEVKGHGYSTYVCVDGCSSRIRR